MSYIKKNLCITFIAIICVQTTIQSAFRNSVRHLSYVMEPLHPAVKGRIQKILQHPSIQEIQHEGQATVEILKKLYTPLEHPLYTKFFEPIYVGIKSPVWGKQIHDQWHYLMMHEHDKFNQIKYEQWKKSLSDNEKTMHNEAIYNYEKAYYTYKQHPNDPTIHHQLLKQTKDIQELIDQHTQPKQSVMDFLRE